MNDEKKPILTEKPTLGSFSLAPVAESGLTANYTAFAWGQIKDNFSIQICVEPLRAGAMLEATELPGEQLRAA